MELSFDEYSELFPELTEEELDAFAAETLIVACAKCQAPTRHEFPPNAPPIIVTDCDHNASAGLAIIPKPKKARAK